ncbi:hypothetical protein [Nocardiopsis nanhaiensis]
MTVRVDLGRTEQLDAVNDADAGYTFHHSTFQGSCLRPSDMKGFT